MMARPDELGAVPGPLLTAIASLTDPALRRACRRQFHGCLVELRQRVEAAHHHHVSRDLPNRGAVAEDAARTILHLERLIEATAAADRAETGDTAGSPTYSA